MQTVKLGDKMSGQLEVSVINVAWAEQPNIFKYDKYSSYKSLYLEVTLEVLKDIDLFYNNEKLGDQVEGKANNRLYYKILMIKYKDSTFKYSLSYEELLLENINWTPFTNLPDTWKDVSFVIEVL